MTEKQLGTLVATNTIDSMIREDFEFQNFIVMAFNRHCNDDWGELCDEDKKLNDICLKQNEGRILSRYTWKGEPIYIITKLYGRSSEDNYTTILLADEY